MTTITKNIKGKTYKLKISSAERPAHNNVEIENLDSGEKIEVQTTNLNGENRIQVVGEHKRKAEEFLGMRHIEKSMVKFQLTDKQARNRRDEKYGKKDEDKSQEIKGFGDPVEGNKSGNSLHGGKVTEEDDTLRHPTEEQVYQ
jgi:ribosomal protein S13